MALSKSTGRIWLVICAACLMALQSVAGLRAADTLNYEVVNTYPHATDAYTQGLIYLDGHLYETTGLYGGSSLRKVDLETGDIVQKQDISRRYFGEGLVNWGDTLIYLTWRSQTAFVYDKASFRIKRRFNYRGEGWGITQNGTHLIMSNGSDTLRFYEPETFGEVREIKVRRDGQPVRAINELEWVKGAILANIWQTNEIVRIDPETGEVTATLDLSALLPEEAHQAPRDNVLNGIAYDAATDRLFVTGKRWSKLYEIRISE